MKKKQLFDYWKALQKLKMLPPLLLLLLLWGNAQEKEHIEEVPEEIKLFWDRGVCLADDYSFFAKQNRNGTAITLTAKELTIT
jgi:hypothetical protein